MYRNLLYLLEYESLEIPEEIKKKKHRDTEIEWFIGYIDF